MQKVSLFFMGGALGLIIGTMIPSVLKPKEKPSFAFWRAKPTQPSTAPEPKLVAWDDLMICQARNHLLRSLAAWGTKRKRNYFAAKLPSIDFNDRHFQDDWLLESFEDVNQGIKSPESYFFVTELIIREGPGDRFWRVTKKYVVNRPVDGMWYIWVDSKEEPRLLPN